MRTEIIERKLYTFDELSDSAKETAREWWRNCEKEDSSCSENVYEQAADIADLFGLDIRTRSFKRMDGKPGYLPCIYFSGFSSQGDGACFEGSYKYKKGALKAVNDEFPQDTELYNIVKALQDLQKNNFYRIACRTKHNGHYYHSGCMQVDCENTYDNREVIDEDDFIQCMRDFADWIYKCLENEYNYIMSNENVDECLRINEYEFDEEGNIA